MMQLTSVLNMERTSFAEMRCSLARALELVGDWWSPLIIRDLFLGVSRFDDLVEDLGISRNLLTRRLHALQDVGVIEKKVYQDRPKRHAYALTEAGRDLVPVLIALTEWGGRWAGPREGRPIVFVHTKCRKRFTPAIVCSECGDAITADTVKAIGGPGGAARPGTKVIAKRLAASA
jgi:DNA-binding HxlR family transcriptional regulator